MAVCVCVCCMMCLCNNADTESTELLEGKFEDYPSRYETCFRCLDLKVMLRLGSYAIIA